MSSPIPIPVGILRLPRGPDPSGKRGFSSGAIPERTPGNCGDRPGPDPGNSGDRPGPDPGNSGDRPGPDPGNSGDRPGPDPGNSGDRPGPDPGNSGARPGPDPGNSGDRPGPDPGNRGARPGPVPDPGNCGARPGPVPDPGNCGARPGPVPDPGNSGREQRARAGLRERFLLLLGRARGRRSRFSLRSGLLLPAELGAADPRSGAFQVDSLQTPLGIQGSALLRSGDVLEFSFSLE